MSAFTDFIAMPGLGPLGGPEILLIVLVVLLLFGAKKLPDLARGMGRSLGEFKKAKTEFDDEVAKVTDEVK
ncbi:MAG: sec-independent protein translocase protein TatA [Verrucomicrobiales bacterium]|jgi:sec-independent protein translocase protein TatA